jgi:uncharacterized protein
MTGPNKHPDRQLGDAWIHWNGRLDAESNGSAANKGTFLGLTFGLLIFSGVLLFIIDYLIGPRLSQVDPRLLHAVTAFFLVLWLSAFMLFGILLFSVWRGKGKMARRLPQSLPMRFFVPAVYRLGRLAGRPSDQITHSFIQVHNSWVRLLARKSDAGKILILLPRCLQKTLLDQVRRFSLIRHIPVYVVSGGEMARRIIEQREPKAVIGVACERDLLAGLRDLSPDIQMIGIPNLRPEGPCRNTLIDFHELETAVQAFQNR